MKRLILKFVLASVLCLGVGACSTTTTSTSYNMAKQNQYVLRYEMGGKDAQAVKNAVISSLKARKWNVVSAEFPIKAQIDNRGQSAVVSITYENGILLVDTKGSTINGKSYVPIRYVDFLMKTVNKTLLR